MQPREWSQDSSVRFLSELRVLRDRAGLDLNELAARAHYPSDVLRAAEAGPTLPDLPVLSAFVRGCGGEVTEWEDRWRVLSGTGGPASLPMRPAGESAAAVAGARAGATVTPPDEHDPDHIMAVLARATDSPPGQAPADLFAATAFPAPEAFPAATAANGTPVSTDTATAPAPSPTAHAAANGSVPPVRANGYPAPAETRVPPPGLPAEPGPVTAPHVVIRPRPVTTARGGRATRRPALVPFAVAGALLLLAILVAFLA